MRRILCGCLVGGLLGTGFNMAWTQDRVPLAGRNPTPFAPVSAAKAPGTAVAPARKSYYAELFGADSGAAGSWTDRSPTADRAPATEDAPPASTVPKSPISKTETLPRVGSLNLTGQRNASSLSADDAVIHAEFEHHPSEFEKNQVMQVRGQRIVRPARRASVDQSALTEPIAIPGQQADIEPLFDAAPAPPFEEPTFDVPASTNGPGVRRPQFSDTATRRTAPPPAAVAAPAPAVPNIRVAWQKQGEVSIGRECRCELVLKNEGAATAQNLEVVALFSSNVRLLSSEPAPAHGEDCLVWEIDELPAGGKQSIQITMLPLAAGEITTQAEVRFSTAVSGSFQIAEPKLAVKLNGPPQTMLGESATQTILITNPGTGVADNVQISAIIPSGLEHARGGELLMDLGALHPGETRNVRLPLAAVAGGQHIVQIEARAEGGLVQQASCAINVIAPQLKTAIDGPSLRYIGRRAAYTVLVTNDGTVPSENVRVMHKAPEGFTFVSADHGGQFDSGTQLLNWFVGRLNPGQTTALAATFECEQIGEFTHFIRATSDQGAVSDSHVRTSVEGTPLLSMSVKDLDDPVETGAETAYEVEIKNEGSASAQHVRLTCELPQAMALIDVSGPTAHRQAAGVVAFAPLDQLRPGESVTMRVHVRSSSAGNLRFRAQLTSESVQEPLIAEELTKFYGE